MTRPATTPDTRPARGVLRLTRLIPLAAIALPAVAFAAVTASDAAAGSRSGLLFAELIGAMIIILAGCELFANGVEHVGEKAHLSHAAAGSLLAAIGTALPETMIPILAILFGAAGSGHDIGIGAILGAPFMLSTLAFFLLGVTVTILWTTGRRRHWQMEANVKSLAFELRWFLLTIAFVFLISLVRSRVLNLIGGAAVLVVYAFYFRRQLGHEAEDHEEYTDTFYLNKFFRLPVNWGSIISQSVLGLAGITIGAHFFVGTIESLSTVLGISALVLSLIIAPIATELPEKYNSITWTIKRQDTLAMGNISGALVFQSTIPVAIGLWFTEWQLGTTEILNLVFTAASAGLTMLVLRSRGRLPAWPLLVGGLFYASYLVRIFLYGASHGQ